jgi:hypothetical protein
LLFAIIAKPAIVNIETDKRKKETVSNFSEIV